MLTCVSAVFLAPNRFLCHQSLREPRWWWMGPRISDGLRGRQTGRARSRDNRDLGQDYAPALHSLRFSKRSNYLLGP